MHALGKTLKYPMYGAMAIGTRISEKITSGKNVTKQLPEWRRVTGRAPSGHETDEQPTSSKRPSTPISVTK